MGFGYLCVYKVTTFARQFILRKNITSAVLRVLLPFTLGAAILYWMYRGSSWDDIRDMVLHRMQWSWMIVSLLFGILPQVLRGLRWRLALEPVGEKPRRATCVFAVFVSYAARLVVPRIGEITRRDVLESSYGNDTHHVILGFNVPVSKDAEAEIATHSIKVMTNEIVYALIDDYKLWLEESSKQSDSDKRLAYTFPAKIAILPDHVFRVSKPAVVGVRVLAGRIRVGEGLIDTDGRACGEIKSVRADDGTVLKEAVQGDEVSVAIDGVTVGRQVNEGSVLYTDMIESGFKEVQKSDLTDDEKLALSDIAAIKRRAEPFWGM